MSQTTDQITVTVTGGPSVAIPWTKDMTVQDALELAWNTVNNNATFSFGLQYYGKTLGYMVFMINETFDSFVSSAAPFFYWEFLVDGVPQNQGIDSVRPSPGQTVSFEFTRYVAEVHAGTVLEAKHAFQTSQTKVGTAHR